MYIISTNHTFYILHTKWFQASVAPSDRFFFRSSGRKKLKSISRGTKKQYLSTQSNQHEQIDLDRFFPIW